MGNCKHFNGINKQDLALVTINAKRMSKFPAKLRLRVKKVIVERQFVGRCEVDGEPISKCSLSKWSVANHNTLLILKES